MSLLKQFNQSFFEENPKEKESFKYIRWLTISLLFSGIVNILFITLFIYSSIKERSPQLDYGLKPAKLSSQPTALDHRTNRDILLQFKQMTFEQLLTKLKNIQLVEDGYTQRDLSLACLVSFHYLDLEKALSGFPLPKDKRQLIIKADSRDEDIKVLIYPGLSDAHYQSIIDYTAKEKWPLTAYGMYVLLQQETEIDSSLSEAFSLTPEFLAVEKLFANPEFSIAKEEILQLFKEGDWEIFEEFYRSQMKSQDQSSIRRQKLLLDLVEKNSKAAAELLIKTEPLYAAKKIDDQTAIKLLGLLNQKSPLAEKFSLDMLTSPRRSEVWQFAAKRLYEFASEPVVEPIDHTKAIARFAPNRVLKEEPKVTPIPLAPALGVKPLIKKEISFTKQDKTERMEKMAAIRGVAGVQKKKDEKTEAAVEFTKAKEATPAKPVRTSIRGKVKTYIVQEGDTLWKIAKMHKVDLIVIRELNKLDSDALKPGTVLKIPYLENP